jgi:hypothetical protein
MIFVACLSSGIVAFPFLALLPEKIFIGVRKSSSLFLLLDVFVRQID